MIKNFFLKLNKNIFYLIILIFFIYAKTLASEECSNSRQWKSMSSDDLSTSSQRTCSSSSLSSNSISWKQYIPTTPISPGRGFPDDNYKIHKRFSLGSLSNLLNGIHFSPHDEMYRVSHPVPNDGISYGYESATLDSIDKIKKNFKGIYFKNHVLASNQKSNFTLEIHPFAILDEKQQIEHYFWIIHTKYPPSPHTSEIMEIYKLKCKYMNPISSEYIDSGHIFSFIKKQIVPPLYNPNDLAIIRGEDSAKKLHYPRKHRSRSESKPPQNTGTSSNPSLFSISSSSRLSYSPQNSPTSIPASSKIVMGPCRVLPRRRSADSGKQPLQRGSPLVNSAGSRGRESSENETQTNLSSSPLNIVESGSKCEEKNIFPINICLPRDYSNHPVPINIEIPTPPASITAYNICITFK